MPILTARDAADLMQSRFAETGGEHLLVAYLDPDGRLLDLQRCGQGDDQLPLPIRSIVSRALALDASGLVIAHNHPSGDPRPSAADIGATRRLALACAALDIRLHDHLVFAGGDCVSFRLEGLL